MATSLSTSEPPVNTGFLQPIQTHNLNSMSIGSALFAQMIAECPYTLLSYKNWPFQRGDLDPHIIHGSVDPPELSTQTASRSVQPFLQGSLVWQTDRPHYSVSNNRPHQPSASTYVEHGMRSSKNQKAPQGGWRSSPPACKTSLTFRSSEAPSPWHWPWIESRSYQHAQYP